MCNSSFKRDLNVFPHQTKIDYSQNTSHDMHKKSVDKSVFVVVKTLKFPLLFAYFLQKYREFTNLTNLEIHASKPAFFSNHRLYYLTYHRLYLAILPVIFRIRDGFFFLQNIKKSRTEALNYQKFSSQKTEFSSNNKIISSNYRDVSVGWLVNYDAQLSVQGI